MSAALTPLSPAEKERLIALIGETVVSLNPPNLDGASISTPKTPSTYSPNSLSQYLRSGADIFSSDTLAKKLSLFCNALVNDLRCDFCAALIFNDDVSPLRAHLAFREGLETRDTEDVRHYFRHHIFSPSGDRSSFYAGLLLQEDKPDVSNKSIYLLKQSVLNDIFSDGGVSRGVSPLSARWIAPSNVSLATLFQASSRQTFEGMPLSLIYPLAGVEGQLFGSVIFGWRNSAHFFKASEQPETVYREFDAAVNFIRLTGLHLEQDRQYRQTIEDNLRIQAAQAFGQELQHSDRFIFGNTEERLKHFCETLTNQSFALIASFLRLTENGIISHRALSVRTPVPSFITLYNDRLTLGKGCDLRLFENRAQSTRKIRSATLFMGLDIKRDSSSGREVRRDLVFLPVYSKDTLLQGYLVVLLESERVNENAIQLLELYLKIAGRELLEDPAPPASIEAPSAQSKDTGLTLTTSPEYSTADQAFERMLEKGLLYFKHASIVYFSSIDDNQPDKRLVLGYDLPQCTQQISRYEFEVALSFDGFLFEKAVCFGKDQLVRVLKAIEEGMNPPIELRTKHNAENNVLEFAQDNASFRLMLPLRVDHDVFGYLELASPRAREISVIRASLQSVIPSVQEASLRLNVLRLKNERDHISSKTLILKELLGSLIQINQDIRQAAHIEEKLNIAALSISMSFGFKYSLIRVWNDTGIITHASYHIHPESDILSYAEKLHEQSRLGAKAPLKALSQLLTSQNEYGYAYFISSREIEAVSRNVLTQPVDTVSDNLNRYLAGDADVEIYLPLYNEQSSLSGIIRLGGLMISNELDRSSFLERLKLISILSKQLAKELEFNELERIRLSEVSEKLRLSKTLATLFEVGTAISQTSSMDDKLRLLCEALAVSTGIQFAIACLHDETGKIEFSQYFIDAAYDNTLRSVITTHYERGKSINLKSYQTIFSNAQFKVGHLNVFCADVRRVRTLLDDSVTMQVIGSKKGLPEIPLDLEKDLQSGYDYLEGYYSHRGTEEEDHYILAIPFYSQGESQSRIVGFLTLGNFADVDSTTDLFSRLSAIDLFVSIVNSDIKNFLLNRSLIRSEAQFKNIVENINLGFLITRQDGRIEYANPALKSALGWGDKELRGKLLEEFAHGSSFESTVAHRESVYSGETATSEILIKTSSNEIIPLEISSTPQFLISDTGELSVVGAFSVLRDLRKQRELEIQEREMETIRNNFYAMVVHDMKVPLSAIYGYTEMLKDASPTDIGDERFKMMMGQMFLSASNITRLVQEILEFSKYESRKINLDYQRQNLQLCVDLVIEQHHYELQSKGILIKRSVEGLGDWTFYFDFDRIVRVLSNLVSNAIKFSPQNSIIEITLKNEENFGRDDAILSIIDHGEGIPPDEVDFVFDAYRQANSKHGSRGTGLGLSIAKQIINLHGGQISAQSTLGKGTTITISLPIRHSMPTAKAT